MDGGDRPFIGRRYALVRALGEGAQGAVHLVEDRYLGNRLLAVKTIRPRATEEWKVAFRHEFEVLAGLNHPRLARVHDFGTTPDGRVFFTRDYIAGRDLWAATEGVGPAGLIGVAVEVCRALAPLHQQGLVHGDLKPPNAILGPDDIARLIDFSFVRREGGDPVQRGTVHYMAPEMIEGKSADVRADLYSLGVTLFEIGAGRLPFEGGVGEVVSGHMGADRPRMSWSRIAPREPGDREVLRDLGAVVERLLARAPQDRFPDARELEAALIALSPRKVAPDPVPPVPVLASTDEGDRNLRRVRDAVVARLESPADRPPLFTVEGALGTGKSTATTSVKWWVQLRGFAVAEASCEGGGGLLDPVAALVDQALGLAERGEAESALGERLLASLERPGGGGMDLDGLALEVGRLLSRIAGSRPLLVVLDDVDNASSEALKVLRGVVAGAGSGAPLAFLATAEAGFPWGEALGRGEGLVLPVMDRRRIEDLARRFFGRVDEKAVERALAHTGGNPLFVRALFQDLAASGEGLERLERLGPPSRLEEYWLERLASLEDDDRRLVEAAAVIGRTASLSEISRVADKGEEDPEISLARLESGGWLRRKADGWHAATGPLAREVVGAADPGRLKSLHERCFELERDEASKIAHAIACERLDFARSRGLEVADGLEAMGALNAARELLESLEPAFVGKDRAAALSLSLGRVCLAQGDYEMARMHLASVGDGAPVGIRRQALLLLGRAHLGRMHRQRSELDQATARLEEALALGGDAGDTGRIYQELANVELRRGDVDKATAHAEAGLDRAPAKHPVRADILGVLGKIASFAGRHDEALARCREAVREARESGERRTLALALDRLSWARHQSGDLSGAAEDLEEALGLNREIGDLPRLVRGNLVLGDIEWWLERWQDALSHYEEAMRLVGAVGNPVQGVEVRIGLGQALAKVGRFERASLVLAEAREDAARLGQEELELLAVMYEGDVAAWQGRTAEALERWAVAERGLESLGLKGVSAELGLEMAEVLLRRGGPGDVDAAQALVERAAACEREERRRGFDAMLDLARAELALAREGFEEGAPMLDRLATRLEMEGPRDLLWQVHLAAARELVERGSDVLARKRLRQAEAVLEQLAAGLPPEHRLAFWQDVRRAEVRRLLAITVPSSGLTLSIGSSPGSASGADLDVEARALYRILELNEQLITETDASRLMESILDSAVELTGAERGFVLVPGDGGLEVRAAREIGRGESKDPHEQFSRSIAESVLLDGEAVVTVDAEGDERFNEFLSIHELKIRSVACLPFAYRGSVLGVIYLENRIRRGRFGSRDLRVLSAFASQVAIAVAQARLLEEARQRGKELEEATRALESLCNRQARDLETSGTDLRIAKERLERVRRRIEGQGDFRGVIGAGSAMSRVFDTIEKTKDLDVPVVFVGESGTGKDLMAQVLHDVGRRRDGPFVPVACGGIPETLIEATLFGHVKGAFSGAEATRPGLLAAASAGTLYLDDIGEMPSRMQVDLLRVLQDGRYTPLGGTEPRPADFRLVASSREPLEGLVERGSLRRDLFYRLQVISVEIPPLRKRPEDVPSLAQRILTREAARMGLSARSFKDDAMSALVAHSWPGNVRELEQVIQRALVVGGSSGEIGAEQLLPAGLGVGAMSTRESSPRRGRPSETMGSEEERRILEALERCRWNRSEAARKLGIPRRTFYRRLAKMGLANKGRGTDG